MGNPDQPEQPQAKRARFADTPLQQPLQGANILGGTPSSATVPSSSTTGANIALPPAAAAAAHHAAKQPSLGASAANTAAASASASAAPRAPSSGAGAAPAATVKPSNFIADAHEAVRFRAVSAPAAEALTAEISAGGQAVSVEFLHQHFGDAEQIRGYSGLKITIWVHVRTYHAWVDIQFAAKRPGADKLGPIFEGAFPAGYCRSQEEFVAASTAAAAAMPDLATLGDCVGTVPLPPTAYGIKAAAAAAAGSAAATGAATATVGAGGVPPLEVSVRRFQLSSAPPEVKALHARLEALLLFTIDGAQFIDPDDPQWELLLPVARAGDGGCLVLGLTTLFNFFSYPASCRLRVSQVLVLSPWQGLGLGKALLKLSYDLAKSRSCADLTVEDPTPNLQRVREKLEVEMLRGLGWVAQQARKCLDAVARGKPSWPAWEEEGEEAPPAKKEADGAGGGDQGTPQQQPQQLEPAVAERELSQQEGQGQQHPLLASHAFFAALGAVPPQNLALPEAVQTEAAAAAEARWRQRLAAAEDAAAKAASVAGSSSLGAAPTAVGGAAGDAAAAAGSGNGSGGSGGGGALAPSASFVSAISRELKMHKGQIHIVWEALLWCEPGALGRPGVRAALEQLVTARLEAQHFSSVGRAAAAKRLVDTTRTTLQTAAGADGHAAEREPDFFMYRPVGLAAAAAADAAAADAGAVATGRLNLTQVSADDKAQRMAELLQERRQQLDSLAAIINKRRP